MKKSHVSSCEASASSGSRASMYRERIIDEVDL